MEIANLNLPVIRKEIRKVSNVPINLYDIAFRILLRFRLCISGYLFCIKTDQ